MTVVESANKHVSILTVAHMLGVRTPGSIPDGKSVKVYCPFGSFYHKDAGASPAMRLYDTNSAYCWAGCGVYSPVSLYAAGMDLSREEAAVALLEATGLRQHLVDQAAWNVVSVPLEAPLPDLTELAAALRTYCARVSPDWEEDQFKEDVIELLDRCLGLLDHVRTDDQAWRWLEKTKIAMAAKLAPLDQIIEQRNGVVL